MQCEGVLQLCDELIACSDLYQCNPAVIAQHLHSLNIVMTSKKETWPLKSYLSKCCSNLIDPPSKGIRNAIIFNFYLYVMSSTSGLHVSWVCRIAIAYHIPVGNNSTALVVSNTLLCRENDIKQPFPLIPVDKYSNTFCFFYLFGVRDMGLMVMIGLEHMPCSSCMEAPTLTACFKSPTI